ncbi:MAG: diversity-generating retroelement protein Avd [Chloroflexi bacterium]|nr:diversity-generating retroelement protein Avd [Chloroflexota bacterium]
MPESPIFVKMYDLLVWLLPRTLKFPREYRFTLVTRLQDSAFNLQRALVRAAKSIEAEKISALQDADVELTQLRLNLRLSHDLNLLDLRGYEHIARLVDEVGRLLGGWQKKSAAT